MVERDVAPWSERSLMVRLVVGSILHGGARCSSVVRAFADGVMGRRVDPSWGGPIELFLVPASATKAVVCAILSVGWCM